MHRLLLCLARSFALPAYCHVSPSLSLPMHSLRLRQFASFSSAVALSLRSSPSVPHSFPHHLPPIRDASILCLLSPAPSVCPGESTSGLFLLATCSPFLSPVPLLLFPVPLNQRWVPTGFLRSPDRLSALPTKLRIDCARGQSVRVVIKTPTRKGLYKFSVDA